MKIRRLFVKGGYNVSDDKPKKYPKAFTTADVLILSKADLLPYLPYDLERVKKEALDLNPRLRIFVLSAVTGEGLDAFVEFLAAARAALGPAHA